jgi:hypothetical protein
LYSHPFSLLGIELVAVSSGTNQNLLNFSLFFLKKKFLPLSKFLKYKINEKRKWQK